MVKIKCNVVQIFFPDMDMMDRLMKGGLRCNDKHLLPMQRWERSKDFSNESFKEVTFWMPISVLLVECYTKEVG